MSPRSGGAFPVHIGRYLEGDGYRDQRQQVSLAFKARIVCASCNHGWMSSLEAEIQETLSPFLAAPFPALNSVEWKQLRSRGPRIALWLAKTALTTSYALPGAQRLPTLIAENIAQQRPPHNVWIDLAKSIQPGIGAALSKTFHTFNGSVFAGSQTHTDGACFQFCLHLNHLLLRIGVSPSAMVGYIAEGGQIPLRLFPQQDANILGNLEYENFVHFSNSVVLRTFAGCQGEVPLSTD